MINNLSFSRSWVWTQVLGFLAVLATLGGMAAVAQADASPREIKPEVIYHNYCSVCHGDRGDGRSRASNSLNPPPKNFTKAANLPRDEMVNAVTNGVPKTAMASWKSRLSAQEIEAVVDYIQDRFIALAMDSRLLRGRSLYEKNCQSCHGDRGQGAALTVAGSPLTVRELNSPQVQAELTRERMLTSLTQGHEVVAPMTTLRSLSKEDIDYTVDFVRAAIVMPASGAISGTSAHGGRSPDDHGKSKALSKAELASFMQAPMPLGLVGDSAKGRKLYMRTCITCHGEKGDGQGPRAYFINPKPKNFRDEESREKFNRPKIFHSVMNGEVGAEMPAWGRVLTNQQIADVSEFVFRAYIRSPKK